MILIYHAAQLKIAGFPHEYCTKSFELAKEVVDVLEFCKKLDPVARRFFVSLLRHYEHLQLFDPSIDETAGRGISADPQPDLYLFAACPKNSPLHGTSEKLSEQLGNPYADEGNMASRQESGDVLDSQSGISEHRRMSREEACRNLGHQTVRGMTKPSIPDLEKGYFVGSSEPSWWLAKRTCVTYSGESMALDA